MTAERGDHRHRQGQARDERRPDAAEEQEDHQHDQHERDEQRDLHVVDRLLDRAATGRTGRRAATDGGSWAWRVGSSALTAVGHLDRVRPRLPLHAQDDRPRQLAGRAVRVPLGEPRGDLVVLDAVDHRRRVRPAGPACRCGRRRSPGGTRRRVDELAGRLDVERLPLALERPGRQVHVRVPDGRRTPRRCRSRGRRAGPGRPAPGPPASAGRTRPPGRRRWTIDSRWARTVSAYSFTSYSGSVSDRRARIRIGEVGRVHLPERRRGGHVRRQRPGGLRDGRLHVQGGRVDVAVEGELQGDRRASRGRWSSSSSPARGWR